MDRPRFEMSLRSTETGVSILALNGELTDGAENAAVDGFTRAASAGARALLLDLNGLTGLDVGGAGLLVKLRAWCDRRGQGLAVFGTPPLLRSAFRVARLDEAVPFCGSEREAVDVATGDAPPPELSPDPETGAPGWAVPTTALLQPPRVPAGALGLQGEDLRPAGPLQGFGPLWERTHSLRLAGASVSPSEVIGVWKEEFGTFLPKGNQAHLSPRGLVPGEVVVLNLSLAGGLPIATGALVLHADDASFTLMTLEGHVQAGWITFSAIKADDTVELRVRSLTRSGDPLYEAGLSVAGQHRQHAFWHRTLESLGARWGVEGLARTVSACIDHRSQWSQATHTRRNAGVRTAMFAAAGLLDRVLRFPRG